MKQKQAKTRLRRVRNVKMRELAAQLATKAPANAAPAATK
jgi:hypothetical protein